MQHRQPLLCQYSVKVPDLCGIYFIKQTKNMRKIAILIAVLFVSTVSVFAQNQITGRVTDANNSLPIPGISVKIKGTDKGATTKTDGSFSISTANTEETLEISGVSFISQTVKAQVGRPLDLTLTPDAKNLNEVVVTALGITRSKNTLPYAAQKIQGTDVSQSRNANFVN